MEVNVTIQDNYDDLTGCNFLLLIRIVFIELKFTDKGYIGKTTNATLESASAYVRGVKIDSSCLTGYDGNFGTVVSLYYLQLFSDYRGDYDPFTTSIHVISVPQILAW